MRQLTFLLISFCAYSALLAQTPDSSSVEEDYSQYDNASFTDASAKRYCSPKVFDLSPQRFISLGWDVQMPYTTRFSCPDVMRPIRNWPMMVKRRLPPTQVA